MRICASCRPSNGIAAAHRCRIAWPTSASVAVTSTSAPAGTSSSILVAIAAWADRAASAAMSPSRVILAGIARPAERRAEAADIGERDLGRVPDARDLAAMQLAQPRIAAQQLGIALHRAELVVQLMAKAADQAADRHQVPDARQRHRKAGARRQLAVGALCSARCLRSALLDRRRTLACRRSGARHQDRDQDDRRRADQQQDDGDAQIAAVGERAPCRTARRWVMRSCQPSARSPGQCAIRRRWLRCGSPGWPRSCRSFLSRLAEQRAVRRWRTSRAHRVLDGGALPDHRSTSAVSRATSLGKIGQLAQAELGRRVMQRAEGDAQAVASLARMAWRARSICASISFGRRSASAASSAARQAGLQLGHARRIHHRLDAPSAPPAHAVCRSSARSPPATGRDAAAWPDSRRSPPPDSVRGLRPSHWR